MDIFRALRDDRAPETYLQTLLRKGAKRVVPYIATVHLPEEIQKDLNIDFSDGGLSLDRPWKTVPRKYLLRHIQKHKRKSPFHPFSDNLKLLRDSEVLIGLDTSNLKNLTNYHICVTNEGKTAVLEELKALHKRIMEQIDKSFTKEPKPWITQGSETDLCADKAVENRPLISYEWRGNKIDRMDRSKPLNFSNLDAGSSQHTCCSITDTGRTKYKMVRAVAVHTEIQAAPGLTDSPAQTIPEIPMNASTQFNPEIDAQEKEERIQNQAPMDESELANQMKIQYDKIMGALTYNGEYDLYKDDYEYLVKEGRKFDVKPAPQYVHYLTLVNTMCDSNKYVSCTAWHPGLCGTVAVAYGESVIFKDEEILSDSDDSDYEVKPSKPEEDIPRMNPVLQANEVIEAALWKDFCHEMLEYYDKKEDTNSYKLGLLTLSYLTHAQAVRDKEIILERRFEDSRPELDELEFVQEYVYEKYNPDTYDSSADLVYKFRLDEYANVPPDSDAPDEYSILKFEDRLKPFLAKDSTPLAHEIKTFNIVWDSNHWILGYSLKEEALVVHRRHFKDALQEDGPLLEVPRPKTFCPFLRIKKTEYRKTATKTRKKIPKRSSRYSTSRAMSDTRRESKRLSKISTASDLSQSSSHSMRSVGGRSLAGRSGGGRASGEKKKKAAQYIEVSDDEEMERYEKENEIVETGPTHSVYIWSINNDLEPMLKCVSPYEVSALSFCPHNGDLLAAGTISGQIVLWDLQGRLNQTDDYVPSQFERYARKELKRRMAWYRELRVPDRLKETAISTMSGAHGSKVIAIQWVHPQLLLDSGHFHPIEVETDLSNYYSLQFLSTSVDGDIKCWDLKKEPLQKPEYMFTERTIARKMKNPKPEMLASLTSKFAEYNNKWLPTYTWREPITESGKGVKGQSSLLASSVQFHTKLYPYARKYPPNPRFPDKMTDLVEYVYNPMPIDQITYSQTAFMGTLYGAVALLSWSGQPPNPKPNDPTDSEMLNISFMEAVHDGPIIGVLRHPFLSDVALSVGGHVFAIWNVNKMTWPIKWKRYFDKQITCCSWSPLKPSLFRIGLTDGTVEIWDLILQSHEPKCVIPAAGTGITGFSSHNLPLPKGLMGACDMNGSLVFYYIPWIYQSWRKRELDALTEMLAKEPGRKKDLQQWAADWRETHVRLNKKLTGVASSSNVKVDLHEDSEDQPEKKKKDDDDDSIFKIGQFEPKKNVPPRDCKAYYRELYKWYLRRRGRTTRLLEEKERKWYEEEEKTIIKDLLKNKRIDLGQLQKAMVPLVQNENRLKAKEGRVIAMLAQADHIFKNAVSKIFNVVNYQISYASKDSLVEQQEGPKIHDPLKEVEFYFGPNYLDAERDFHAKVSDTNFIDRPFQEMVQEKLKKRELFNDRRRFWDPEEKWMRILARNIIEESGFICGQWEPHELTYEYRKYTNRIKNIDEYKALFGDNYDPLWDAEKTNVTNEDFPYKWPYVTEDDFQAKDSDEMYKSEQKLPVRNLYSSLDLDFIANTEQDVGALMLHEQQQGPDSGRANSSVVEGLDERIPQTRIVPLSNSQLSLFENEGKEDADDEADDDIDGQKKSIDALSEELEDDFDSVQLNSGKLPRGSSSKRSLGGGAAHLAESDVLILQSSADLGISTERSKIAIESKLVPTRSSEAQASKRIESQRLEAVSLSGEGGELGEYAGEGEEDGGEFENIVEPENLEEPVSARSAATSEPAEVPDSSGSDQVLLPGDPLYPENWREICEDECMSEGESIPSPRSSPSNITDFSEITEVELFEPSDMEDEPYQEYFEDGDNVAYTQSIVEHPPFAAEEEPTEEYMGESEDETESEGVKSKKRGPSLLKGKPVASSSSGSSDDDDEKRQDLERTFSQIIADRTSAMAEREQELRDLD